MHAPSFAKIFSLYSSLQYGVVLQDWIEQNHTANYNIDVRRFISFGVIKGFLYRVHKYPILDYYDPVAALAQQSAQSAQSTPLATSSTPATTPAATSSRATVASTPTTTGTPSTATRIHSPLSHTLSTPALATNATIPSAATTTLTTTTTSANALPTTPAAVPSIARKMYGSTLAPTDQGYFSQHHGSSAQQQSQPSAGEGIAIPPVLVRLLDGQHHYDELCTQFGCSVRQLDAILSTDSRVKFIYR
ncbi:Nitrogen permease regulator 2 [Lunasporangiospora selenospora]|uniref:Nitrogen permease regulator 2 n=1 Tax=Lunasporangiospora selenospora TaxID=979761 RepID=A0A9P6FK07_9FUNG|nr:Nitrogen permease regulator 2 [Lunasporangiospora selenospora]